jgi:hypothetical protein
MAKIKIQSLKHRMVEHKETEYGGFILLIPIVGFVHFTGVCIATGEKTTTNCP